MNGSTLTLGLVGALAAAGALSRRGSRSEQTWYVHGTRADLAKEIVSSGVMRGSESRKFGNREVVFATEQSERARDAVNAWASARYSVYKNPGKGGTAVVRFRASRPPDWTGKGEVAWMGDLVIENAHIVDEKSQQALKQQAEARWGRGSRAKSKPATLAQRGLPTTWFHGTKASFTGPLKPNKGMGGACIWLADREGAAAYGPRIIRVELDPGTRVVDLSDTSDPFVREFIRLDASASNMYWHGREDVTAQQMADAVVAWQRRTTHYDTIEARGWAKGYFRKAGVDALLVRDVRGWGGYQSMPSLCVLNRAKISSQRAQGAAG
jgi:hypothetical protein